MKNFIIVIVLLLITKVSAQVIDIPVYQLLDSNLNIECGLFADHVIADCHDSIPHVLDMNLYCQDQCIVIELAHDQHIEKDDTIVAPSSERNLFVLIDSHNNHFLVSSNCNYHGIPMVIIAQRNHAKFVTASVQASNDESYSIIDDGECFFYCHYKWANGHLTKID